MRDSVLPSQQLCDLYARVNEGDHLDSRGGGEDLKVGAADGAAAHEGDPRGGTLRALGDVAHGLTSDFDRRRWGG